METDTPAFFSSSPAPEPREEDGQTGHMLCLYLRAGRTGLAGSGRCVSFPPQNPRIPPAPIQAVWPRIPQKVLSVCSMLNSRFVNTHIFWDTMVVKTDSLTPGFQSGVLPFYLGALKDGSRGAGFEVKKNHQRYPGGGMGKS